MTRTELSKEIERSAALHGLRPCRGALHSISRHLADPPLLWAGDPVLESRLGRREGTARYRVPIRLIDLPRQDRGREVALEEMDRALRALVVSMGEHDDIVGVPSLGFATEENALTGRGEVSLTATLTVETRF